MFRTKIRATLVTLAAAAALSATALPGIASATIAQPQPQPSPVPQLPVVQSVSGYTALDAGSAGIDGYGDDECQGLLHDYNSARQYADDYAAEGNTAEARSYNLLAQSIYNQMSDNCLVVKSA